MGRAKRLAEPQRSNCKGGRLSGTLRPTGADKKLAERFRLFTSAAKIGETGGDFTSASR